ncbi:MAG: hypothetical protein AB7S41_01425 [Parvibaculaceae bacterium]
MRGSGLRKLFRAAAGALLCALIIPAQASAATVPAHELEARRQALLQQMLVDPDNLEVAFQYAALSVEANDLEAAITTLERLLIYAPGLASLQYELGVLYFRIGSYETARGYFNLAIRATGASAELIKKAEDYLRAIEYALRSSTITAALYTGMRWQSNANAGPDSDTVQINGAPVNLGGAAGKSDFSGFAIGSMLYSLDLQNQGDKFEVLALTYNAWFTEQSRLDTDILEANVGPNFNMGRFGIDDTYLGIYAIGSGALLSGDGYFANAGAGVKLEVRPAPGSQIFSRFEYRRRWYDDHSNNPNASDRTGDKYSGIVAYRYFFTPDVSGSIAGRFAREETRENFLDNWEYGVQGALNVVFDGPGPLPDYPWAVNLSGGYLHRDFDAPDPAVNAQAKENDDEYWVAGRLSVPVHKNVAIMPQVEYRNVDSNYKTRDYDSFTAMLGLLLIY